MGRTPTFCVNFLSSYIFKPRRGCYHIALQEIGHAVCPSVRLSDANRLPKYKCSWDKLGITNLLFDAVFWNEKFCQFFSVGPKAFPGGPNAPFRSTKYEIFLNAIMPLRFDFSTQFFYMKIFCLFSSEFFLFWNLYCIFFPSGIFFHHFSREARNTSGFGMKLCFSVRIGLYWGILVKLSREAKGGAIMW